MKSIKPIKSIQMKILILVWSFIIVSSMVVIFVGYGYVDTLLQEDSEQIMTSLCKEKSQEINEVLSNIEQSVNTVYYYAERNLTDINDLKNEEYLNEHVAKVKEVAENVVKNTEGAISIYYRFNPEVSITPLDGFYMSMDEEGNVEDTPITDLSKYGRDDMEYVNWYYIPIDRGEPSWLDPYDNLNINVKMISYIIPMFRNGKTVGVLGMDINTELIYDMVESVSVYDSGFGALLDSEGNMIYNKDIPNGITKEDFSEKLSEFKAEMMTVEKGEGLYSYEYKGNRHWMAMNRLRNDMFMCLNVPEREISAPKWSMVYRSLNLVVLLIFVFSALTVRSVQMLVKPLKELTVAAGRIAEGNLDVEIECNTGDEIEELANSFEHTAQVLKQKMNYINGLAYRDGLTQTGNKTAYEAHKMIIEDQIHRGVAQFAVVVLDINNLKWLNDTYGHEKGDLLIKGAAELIQKVFDGEEIYRIGGDEFVTILTGEKLEKHQEYMKRFAEAMERCNLEEREYEGEMRIASGIAVYDKKTDKGYKDVFRRADHLMYKNKKEMKESEKKHYERNKQI